MHKNQFGITRMNLEHLKTFHVVASLGSFTEAAKALYMTQPAVSQQIQGIEHALRNPLFDRSKRQIRLTAKGKILFSYTQKLFGIFREIENVFSDLNHLLTGELTIAASAVMGNYFLSSFIGEFYKKISTDFHSFGNGGLCLRYAPRRRGACRCSFKPPREKSQALQTEVAYQRAVRLCLWTYISSSRNEKVAFCKRICGKLSCHASKRESYAFQARGVV